MLQKRGIIKSKKLQAAVIVSVLFVLLSIASVSTVYVFINNNVDTTDQANLGTCISTIGQFEFVNGCYNATSKNVSITIKRSNENYILKSINFYLEDGGSSKTYEQILNLPIPNDARTYSIDAGVLGLSSVSKIRAIPVLEGVGICTDGQIEKVLSSCSGGVDESPVIPETCSYTYSDWTPETCPESGEQTRIVLTALPVGCSGTPVLSQTCTYVPLPPVPVYSWCYQESANVATACGGLASGSYSVTASGWDTTYVSGNTYDGLWSNYGRKSSSVGQVSLESLYAIPNGAEDSSLWQVRDDEDTINLSIPTSCWIDPLHFKATSFYESSFTPSYAMWSCYTGSSWLDLRIISKSINPVKRNIYEEAMYWNMSS